MRTQATTKAFSIVSLFCLLFSFTSIAKTFHIVSSGGNKFDCELIEVLEGGDYVKVKVTSGVSTGKEIRLKSSILSPKDQAEVKTIFEKNKELNQARQEAEAVRQAELKKEKERLSEQNKEQAKKDFLDRFEKKKDEFQNMEFWTHRLIAKYDHLDYGYQECKITTYLSVSKNWTGLRLFIFYKDKDWLFAEDLIFLIDGKRYPVKFDTFKWSRDVGKGYITESIDKLIDNDSLFIAMKKAKSVKYRLDGKKGNFDTVLSDTNRQIMVETYLAYQMLKGKDVDLSGIADLPEDKSVIPK